MKLNDGTDLPQVGLGVYKVDSETTLGLVESALNMGYRLIDTGNFYGNEASVGEAIRSSSVPRKDVFVTSKLWLDDLGYDQTLRAFELSLKNLDFDYLDCYMIHWPAPLRGLYNDSWKAMVELQGQGLIRTIGVSNFHSHHLEELISKSDVTPSINQVELHPWLNQQKLREFHKSHGIGTQSWSPLARGQIFSEPALGVIAGAKGVSIAQVVLRWHFQNDLAVIPKTVSVDRLEENLNIFDFILSSQEMSVINSLDRNYRTGVDPDLRN